MEETYEITLPQWLDDYIFNELGANYCPRYSDMVNIDDNKEKTLNYLGTYFPRSYAEACVLFTAFFDEEKRRYANKNKLTIFDFGCGTGGEIIGLLMVIDEQLPHIQDVEIAAFDGNHSALRIYEKILAKFRNQSRLNIKNRLFPAKIYDLYDLGIIDDVINQKFDLIITFKAICEFISKQQLELHNPYKYIAEMFLPKLENDGFMVMEDITVKSEIMNEWLPKIMDQGLDETRCEVVYDNPNYNIAIYVTHSRRVDDVSKVAWRIIKNI